MYNFAPETNNYTLFNLNMKQKQLIPVTIKERT